MQLLRWDQFHWAHFFPHFFHFYFSIFSIFPFPPFIMLYTVITLFFYLLSLAHSFISRSTAFELLKNSKIWLWSSAKDHIGRKKVRGSRWWCLFRPSWPRNWFISKKWWHLKIPIVNSGSKLLKNLKNRFLSFFPTDFLHLWTKTPTKHHSN